MMAGTGAIDEFDRLIRRRRSLKATDVPRAGVVGTPRNLFIERDL
jgi:hypothetical protein